MRINKGSGYGIREAGGLEQIGEESVAGGSRGLRDHWEDIGFRFPTLPQLVVKDGRASCSSGEFLMESMGWTIVTLPTQNLFLSSTAGRLGKEKGPDLQSRTLGHGLLNWVPIPRLCASVSLFVP